MAIICSSPLLVLALAAVACAAFVLPPTPPRQTPTEAKLVAAISGKAEGLSAAAVPDVLALFDDEGFRSILNSCCVDIAHLSAQDLLARFQAEVAVTEIAHNIIPNVIGGRDVNLTMLQNSDYFYNLWEVDYLNLTGTTSTCNNPSEVNAEETIFGFPPFTSWRTIEDFNATANMSFPASYAEAIERPVYGDLNLRKVDIGNPTFGTLSFVMSRPSVDSRVFFVPMDTGIWEMSCNSSAPPMRRRFSVNCSGWDLSLGTPEYYNHLVLPSINSWNDSTPIETLGYLFARMFAPDALKPAVTTMLALHYWEANIAGTIVFPDDIHFVVASFPALFGTSIGRDIQAWCASRRWPLLWALGDPTSTQWPSPNPPANFAGVGRALDVTTLSATHVNRTASADVMDKVEDLWGAVSAARNATTGSLDPTLATSLWKNLRTILPSDLLVSSMTAYACAQPDSCVGIDAVGDCACVA